MVLLFLPHTAVMHCILVSSPILISVATFLCYAATGGVLTAENVFVSMALFNVMRFQLTNFPMVLSQSIEVGYGSLCDVMRCDVM
jgi:hypothetical protein